MAGQPRKRALIAELEKRTRDRFEDGEHTLLDYVADWCETKTLKSLASELAEDNELLKALESRAITHMLRLKFGADTVDQRLLAARRQMAANLVEDAIDDAARLPADKDEVARMRAVNDVRFWTAERYNREAFGQPKQQGVVINIGTLHLDAMRRRVVEAPASPLELGQQGAIAAVSEAIAEVVE